MTQLFMLNINEIEIANRKDLFISNKYCYCGLEQAEELERYEKIKSNSAHDYKDSTEVLGSMDRVRELIGLNFKN